MANQLGDYLKARRAGVKPEDVDLPPGGTRRVPGLRREEVAAMAGLSVDYYTRLEQGREQHPSPSVLNSLARVLRLGPDAQRYLFAIATQGPPVPPVRRQLSPNLLRLVNDWTDHPALITDPCHNIVVANHLGRAIYGGHQHSDNLARLVFLDPAGRTFYRNWNNVAGTIVASIRAAASNPAVNAELMALVGELTVRSEEFSKRWAKAEVLEKTSGQSFLRHPIVGDLDLTYETFKPNGAPDLQLKIYRAEKGSEMSEKLTMLGSLTAAQPDEPAALPDERTVR
ncbi:helix-turn-helix transcriptional regulator [Actinocrispum wychmicini]|uniref:Helix-turn-helix protein n=1 Tax=Actinocrispum wychmicini TaxID=1213861 RepID=A0A4R2J8H8_9PSEU|nr:helix-turn-helix transcriptional regulator [Actinocrispum wychmicini]TCO54924.1 helix-turn-helix protein [Actinocrispum wychmicini]